MKRQVHVRRSPPPREVLGDDASVERLGDDTRHEQPEAQIEATCCAAARGRISRRR